jgi:hypothetical protein
MDWFDENILEMIRKFSHKFYVVNVDQDVACICINNDTKQPDPNCKKCLGTGNKIKIKRVDGAWRNSNIPPTIRGSADVTIARLYYLKCKYPIKNEDIIVDENEVYNVYKTQLFTSFEGKHVYYRCLTIPKKLDPAAFMKNFNQIIGR